MEYRAVTDWKQGKRLPAIILIAGIMSACAAAPEFVPAGDIKPLQTVELTNIEDYENLIKKKRIKTIFYTTSYFMAEKYSTLYILASRGYTNFHDYKEGKLAVPEVYSIFKPGYPLKRVESKRK